MGIAHEILGHVVIVSPVDRLDVVTAPELAEIVQRSLAAGARTVIVDLAAVTYLSSFGVGTLVKCAKLAQGSGARIKLSGASGRAADVLELTNVLGLFEVHPSRDAALAAAFDVEPHDERPIQPATAHPAAPEAAAPTLTLPEEILLLALRDDGGRFIDLPEHALDHAIAGALLAELCLRRRIDTDLEELCVVDPSPLGDELLDPVLASIAAAERTTSARSWIAALVGEAAELRGRVADRLIERGILRRERSQLLWVLGGRRYPLLDGAPQREVKQRVLAIIDSDEIPAPRDVIVIGLAEACAVFDALLGFDEMLDARPRIHQIMGMDLIARSMFETLVAAQQASRESEQPGIQVPTPDAS